MNNVNNQSKEHKIEVKKLRNDVKRELSLMKKVSVPQLQLAHLERILRLYKRIHILSPPSVSDKAILGMIKIQYRGMCTISRVKPQRDLL